MNMVLRKRHIILASLVLALGVAVYLNYQFAQTGNNFVQTANSQSTKNYGDAQFVDKSVSSEAQEGESSSQADSASTQSASEYFTAARLSREQSRDEAVETLGQMIAQEGIDQQQKDSLTMQATQIAQTIETESKIENMVKAKGFAECMVYLDGENANVSVQTEGLLPEEAAQIKDILLRETDVPVQNISIVEVK